jgi:hypothetical protein
MDVFTQPSDFTNNPLTIPANYLMVVTDVNGNVVAHRDVSRSNAQTDNNGYFANKFADTTFYAYPLTVTFTLDPNAAPASTDADFV